MKKLACLLLVLSSPCFAQDAPANIDQLSLSYSATVKKTAPAVVNIYTKRKVQVQQVSPFMNDPFFRQFFGNQQLQMQGQPRERMESSLGSGVLIDAKGLVVTAHHVIKDASEIRVVLSDKREFDATIERRDPKTDLAYLRIKADGALPYLTLRDSDTLEVGDVVLAIGNPFGVGQTVTHGIISALARRAANVSDYQFFIQTDAPINPGNSGGALVDSNGQLIGINTAIYSTSGGSNGIGFAIPSNIVKVVMNGKVAEGNVIKPWVGITIQPVTPEIAESLGLKKVGGVLVAKVDPKGSAAKAGLKSGDIILSIAGNPIDDEMAFSYRVQAANVGDVLEVKYLRGGEEQTTQLTLVAEQKTTVKTLTLHGNNPLDGVTIATLNEALARDIGVDPSARGVLVVESANPNFQKGDVIMQINGEKVATAEAVMSGIKKAKRGLQVIYQRGTLVMTLVVR